MQTILMGAAQNMAIALETALPSGQKHSFKQLLDTGIQLTQSQSMRPYMQLSLEIAARASRNESPYNIIAPQIISGFLTWIEIRLDTTEHTKKRDQAIALLALIDGLGVLRVGLEPDQLSSVSKVISELD